MTVGGGTEQFLWRFVVGAALGTSVYVLLDLLGGTPVAQGIVFFIFVFLLTYLRVKIPRTDIGVTFATLACVYAVDYSYRRGNISMVNTEGLTDLLRAWAFGVAISLVRVDNG